MGFKEVPNRFNTFAQFPLVGAENQLYIATDTDEIYRWNGSAYVLVGDGSGTTGVTSTNTITDNTLVRGDGGVRGVQDSNVLVDDSDNISGVTSLNIDGATGNTLVVGTNVLVADATNGRIGIGDAAPVSSLHIDTGLGVAHGLTFGSNGTGLYEFSSGQLRLRTASFDRAAWHADGGMSIGSSVKSAQQLYVAHTFNDGDTGTQRTGFISTTLNEPANSAANLYSLQVDLSSVNGNTSNYTGAIRTANFTANHSGDGDIGTLIVFNAQPSIASASDGATVTSMYGGRSSLANLSTTSDLVNGYGYRVETPTAAAGGITNIYGFYVRTQAGANITNAFAYYQEGTDDLNFFAGNTERGGYLKESRRVEAVSFTTSGHNINAISDLSVPRTITLSSADALNGITTTCKDESGNAGTNNLTIDTEGSETIDGQTSIAITVDRGGAIIYSDNSNWHVKAKT